MTVTTTWVRGDGTTAAGRARRRAKALTWLGVVATCIALVVWAAVWTSTPTSEVPLGSNNPRPAGAQAVARVLTAQGVSITTSTSAQQAVTQAGAGSTILVTDTWELSDDDVAALGNSGADLVLLDPQASVLEALTAGSVSASWSAGGTPQDQLQARCDVPAATTAGTIAATATTFTSDSPDTTICFPDSTGAGAMSVTSRGGHTITALADPAILTNAAIEADGHAALALWVLGAQPALVWLIPSSTAGQALDTGTSMWEFFPPWASLVALQLLVIAVLAMLWRGRRLGALVSEPLPVEVPASETTLGRARLYRQAHATEHAAAALRAGTASRIARHCGLHRSAGRTAIVAAAAHVTGQPAAHIDAVLYGPAPTTDAALAQLARALHTLESELT